MLSVDDTLFRIWTNTPARECGFYYDWLPPTPYSTKMMEENTHCLFIESPLL